MRYTNCSPEVAFELSICLLASHVKQEGQSRRLNVLNYASTSGMTLATIRILSRKRNMENFCIRLYSINHVSDRFVNIRLRSVMTALRTMTVTSVTSMVNVIPCIRITLEIVRTLFRRNVRKFHRMKEIKKQQNQTAIQLLSSFQNDQNV